MADALNRILTELGITEAMLAARGLRPCEEARNLALADTGSDGREHLLVPEAAAAWQRMQAAARHAGVDLIMVSAFRSVARQVEIVRRKLDAGQTLDDILSVCAPPGYSEHHTGRAVDLTTPGAALLELDFESTSAFDWLTRQADRYGFELSYPRGNAAGYQYEPWHWCYRCL